MQRGGCHAKGRERRQPGMRALAIEHGVVAADAEEEPVTRDSLEVRSIEHRMSQARQSAEEQRAAKRADARAENAELDGGRDESRPAVERPPAGVDRIIDD